MKYLLFIFLIQYCFSLAMSIKISPCANWNKTGKTIAGSGSLDNSTGELRWPTGIFISKKTNALYVADFDNKRVEKFKLNESPITVITVVSNVEDPAAIYIDDDNDKTMVYIALQKTNRVEKWIEGETSGIQVGDECRTCSGVWLDKEKNIYMTEAARFQAVKWSPNTNITTTVAGQTDQRGSTDNLLNTLGSIYVHPTDGTIYIADRMNNRIQKWCKDAIKGVTVAGLRNTTSGADAFSLNNPYGVFVDDQTDVIYVSDSFNNRVQRWLSNALVGDTIAGGFGVGDASNQLNNPQSLAFDNDGNLYVSDTGNHRIQMFKLIDNQPCSPTSSANLSAYKSTTITMIFFSLIWFIIKMI